MTGKRVFLRKIVIGRWLTDPVWLDSGGFYNDPDWLPSGEMRADCLADLNSAQGDISTYVVDPTDPHQILRVGAALIATTRRVQNFDYCLIDEDVLTATGIEYEAVEGDTPDPSVNAWHHDFVRMTVRKTVALATAIQRRDERRARIQSKKIEAEIRKALDESRYDESRIDKDLLAKMRPPQPSDRTSALQQWFSAARSFFLRK
jgi:hypothetical protein